MIQPHKGLGTEVLIRECREGSRTEEFEPRMAGKLKHSFYTDFAD